MKQLTILAAIAGLLLASACTTGGRRASRDATNGTGSDATQAIDGTSGTDGTSGNEGTDGTNGTEASDGTDGTPGTEGTDGTSGAEGTDGTPGTDGMPGTDGADGTDGIPCEVHTDCPPMHECVEGDCQPESTSAEGCESGADQEALSSGSAFSTVLGCANECEGQSSCVATCAKSALGVSDPCAGCVGDLAGCAAETCFDTCIGGDQVTCYSCLSEVCGPQWEDCSGRPLPEPGDPSCTPSCAGKTCGSNGCGGTCGECSAGTTCQGGTCAASPSGCGGVSFEGCCAGDTLKYCDQNELKSGPCDAGTCGWDDNGKYYNCGTSGTEDPSGSNPKACP